MIIFEKVGYSSWIMRRETRKMISRKREKKLKYVNASRGFEREREMKSGFEDLKEDDDEVIGEWKEVGERWGKKGRVKEQWKIISIFSLDVSMNNFGFC